MKATELHKLSKQCGQYIVEFKDGKLNGYIIRSFVGYEPDNIELVKTISGPDGAIGWDGAYDLLFGKPTAPDFTKVFNN